APPGGWWPLTAGRARARRRGSAGGARGSPRSPSQTGPSWRVCSAAGSSPAGRPCCATSSSRGCT
ncbi:hypothetical protein HGM15179_021199, partial [Zosterops borbonicus]